ncbi:MAG: hypothetical protein Q8N81_02005 [bacterium]|nr:hypothetical protein [bacterium]
MEISWTIILGRLAVAIVLFAVSCAIYCELVRKSPELNLLERLVLFFFILGVLACCVDRIADRPSP